MIEKLIPFLCVVGYLAIGTIIQAIHHTIQSPKDYYRSDLAPPLFFLWGLVVVGFLFIAPFYYLFKGTAFITKKIIFKKDNKQLNQNHKRVVVEDKELEEAYLEVEQTLNSKNNFKQFESK